MSILPSKLKKGKSFGSRYQGQRIASGQAITTGQTLSFDVDVSDFDNLTVLVSMTAGALTDLVLTVCPFDANPNGQTAHLLPLSPSAAPQAQQLVSGNALATVQYDLRGIDVVEIQVKNANAATKSINFIDIYAGVTGADIN